jgi:phage anti-repressor protein
VNTPSLINLKLIVLKFANKKQIVHICINNVTNTMELQIFISKKGTKVVRASHLHITLGLSKVQYARNIKRWITDVYEFSDGIRKPIRLQDFAKRPKKEDSVVDDYYLSVEMAKLITLASNSKVKLKHAKFLASHENRLENADLFTKDQVLAVVEMSKVMGRVSCQEACEQRHLDIYASRNGGLPNNWWGFRSKILGYSTQELRKKLKAKGKAASGKNQRQMLMQTDKYEMIRTGVIDLFMSLGKTERYAKTLGDLAKRLAKELNVEIFDDRHDMAPSFLPPANPELMQEIKGTQKGHYLSLWQS